MAKRSVRKERRWPLVWWSKPLGTLREQFMFSPGTCDGTPEGSVYMHALDCIAIRWAPEVMIWKSRI
jgi:hypothetical protein